MKVNDITKAKIAAYYLILLLTISCTKPMADTLIDNELQSIKLIRNDGQSKVDVLIENKLFTSYLYSSKLKKPVLYPLVTPIGTKITRSYPLGPSVGERVDHPHHVGLWFNYGDVNGLDFWNNSAAIKPEKRAKYGHIVHRKIEEIKSEANQASLVVEMDWLSAEDKIILKENTQFVFSIQDDVFVIDRITRLTAIDEPVLFKDNKEGMIGIRTSRALEHPSTKGMKMTDANGEVVQVDVPDNTGVHGNYLNSEGVEGKGCWGKRADWVNLRSSVGDEDISLVILDHPSNVGYPTYWHARDYGLFAANPLGQSAFSKGKDVLNFGLAKGESTMFRHRVLIASKNLDSATLNESFKLFANLYKAN